MLKMTRKVGGDTLVKVLDVKGKYVDLGFESPKDSKGVWRKEVWDRKKEDV